jgi:uncharacterized damage-inducible protein DinB
MNSIITEYWPLFAMYQSLRAQLMEILSDEDLRFTLGGDTPTLGALCKEIGETEQSYIDSFHTFRCDFTYRNPDSSLEQSVAGLMAWYAQLDQALKAAVEGLSEEDVQNRLVDRGPNFQIPPRIQLNIYQEALLIFYGKAWVYVKALGKPLPNQWQAWIG